MWTEREEREGVPAVGDPGRASAGVGPGRLPRFPESADHELTESVVPCAQVRAASVRGLMHRYQGTPRQDRFSVVFDQATSTLVVTVCDGVGEFELSHEAAAFVAAEAPRAYLCHRGWPEAIAEVNDRLTAFAAGAADRPRLDAVPRDPRMATTLAAAAVCLEPDRRVATIAWTDDTAAWFLRCGQWECLTPAPGRGDGGSGLHSGRVRGLPHPDPRVQVIETSLADGALFVVSDGIGEPLLQAGQVREALAQWWVAPPDAFTFARQVGFARKSHVDDRTAVGVWFDPV